MDHRQDRQSQRPATIRGRRTVSMMVAFAFVSSLLVLGVGPAAEAAVCDDGRGWTADRLRNGQCEHVNICVPHLTVELQAATSAQTSGGVQWRWTFPDSCPMGSVDAVGVLIERRVGRSADDDLGAGTTGRLENRGVGAPARRGGGALAATCGPVELRFMIVAGPEIIATGQGRADTRPCPEANGPTDPAGSDGPRMLGRWDGSTGPVGSLARLYWAVFARQPDTEGFSYWMARIDGGLTIRQTATIWTGLPEWLSTYGDADDDAFLDRVYRNVLGRAPEQAGFDYWAGRLDEGLSRSELVLLVSDAPEFRQRTNTR